MVIKAILVLALAGICLVAMAPPASREAAVTGYLSKSLKHGGREYKYVVYVPRDYGIKTDKKWPLILFLHGAGECGDDGWKQVVQGLGGAMLWNAEKWPFIVVFPQKPEVGKQWEEFDAPVMKMLAETEKEFAVDSERRYLTGLSQGGHGTWTFAGNHPETWAAIAPVCGYVNRNVSAPELDDSYSALAAKIKGTPVWAFHGDADNVVPPAATRSMVDALKGAGANVKASIYPGVNHNSWDKAYREENLGAWFLQQKRAK